MRRNAEAARDHILAAAEDLLIQKGPLSLKLAEVAQAAGVANASVMHHFGSIDGLHAALMERMVNQLVAAVLAAPSSEDDPEAATEAVLHALFEVFETRGAARLAAWLELAGEAHRLTTVREAIQDVITRRIARGGVSIAAAQDVVLVNLVVAMGAGLFGRPLAELIGRPPGRTRKLAADLIREQALKLARQG